MVRRLRAAAPNKSQSLAYFLDLSQFSDLEPIDWREAGADENGAWKTSIKCIQDIVSILLPGDRVYKSLAL